MMNAPLPRPDALVFDWDGTLVDTLPLIRHCLNETFAALGHAPWTVEEVRRRIHRSARDFFPELFGDRWQVAFDLYATHYRDNHLAMLHEMPGAGEFLDGLARLGHPLALISNKRGRFLRPEVKAMGWEHHFAGIVGAEDTPRDKPDPAPWQFIRQNSVLQNAVHVWYIGDTVTDMQFARNCNLTGVLLRSIPPEDDLFHACLPSCHVRNFGELTELLRNQG